MKKIILSAMFFGAFLIFNQAQAQPRVSVNIQVGPAPAWIPAGYSNADYYYLPDIQTYYYVPQRQFIYMEGNRWVRAAYLPDRYRSYDLYRGHKFMVNEPRPYLHDNIYRERYGRDQRSYDRHSEHQDHGRGHAYGRR